MASKLDVFKKKSRILDFFYLDVLRSERKTAGFARF